MCRHSIPLSKSDVGSDLGLDPRKLQSGVDKLVTSNAQFGAPANACLHTSEFEHAGRLDSTLAALASDTVTTIVHSHTDVVDGVRLNNSAAIFQQGSAVGLY